MFVAHGSSRFSFARGLARIEDEQLLRVAIDELMACGKWRSKIRMSYARPKSFNRRDASVEVVAEDEVVVGLALDELRKRLLSFGLAEPAQVAAQSRIGGNPADDASDELVLVRQLEEPSCFAECLPGLHGGTMLSMPGCANLGFEIGRQEVAADRRHGVGDPVVLDGVVLPEVMVGVDFSTAHFNLCRELSHSTMMFPY